MITKIIAQELIDEVQSSIENAEKIVIVAHVGPDGDAMGSSLALWHYLAATGKEATVIMPSDYPAFLAWMPGADKVLDYKRYSHRNKCEQILGEAELIFVLDLNESRRMSNLANPVLKSAAKKILIDHHIHPENFTSVQISHPEISSTSEMIFRIICRMGNYSKINLDCARCIYTGMMTDTGAFTFNSNSPEIYSIVYELLKIGVDKSEIYQKVYDSYSADRMRLVGYALYSKMKIYPEYKTAIIALTSAELKEFNHKTGDTEGLVNLPLQISDVVFSVFIREDTDKIKISLRSQGKFPTNRVASDLFGGGGHLNASGGESYKSLEETVLKMENALPDYAIFLN